MNTFIRPKIDLTFESHRRHTPIYFNAVQIKHAFNTESTSLNKLLTRIENDNNIMYYGKGNILKKNIIKKLLLKENKLKKIYHKLEDEEGISSINIENYSITSRHYLKNKYRYKSFIKALKVLPKFKILMKNKISCIRKYVMNIHYPNKYLFSYYYSYFKEDFKNICITKKNSFYFCVTHDNDFKKTFDCNKYCDNYIDIFYYLNYPNINKKQIKNDILTYDTCAGKLKSKITQCKIYIKNFIVVTIELY